MDGDFNCLEISEILDSYGAQKQIISGLTRKTATLEIILMDLHTLPPLQVDSDNHRKDGDHNSVVLAPICNINYKMERKKRRS